MYTHNYHDCTCTVPDRPTGHQRRTTAVRCRRPITKLYCDGYTRRERTAIWANARNKSTYCLSVGSTWGTCGSVKFLVFKAHIFIYRCYYYFNVCTRPKCRGLSCKWYRRHNNNMRFTVLISTVGRFPKFSGV